MAGLFDIFTNKNAQDAANAQIGGLNQGYNLASNAINTGSQDLTQNYTAALQPYLQNYGQAQQGTQALMNALGLGGASGNASALQTLQNTPGYQFQLGQGSQNVLRNSAQTGTTASGATLNALQNQGQGQAQQTYNNYVSQLQPFLGQENTAAAGIGGTYTGLGNQLNANQGSLANLGWQYGTGVGNANANAALANNQASSNMWNALGSGAEALAMFSDERLKEDIKPIGELRDGQPIYSYRYVWDDPAMTRIGLMAQDVEKTNPDAVSEVAGFKTVDYGRATQFSAELAKFTRDEEPDNVVSFKPRDTKSYTSELSRFLEAA